MRTVPFSRLNGTAPVLVEEKALYDYNPLVILM